MIVGFCTMSGVIPEDLALATAWLLKINRNKGGGGGEGRLILPLFTA